jgi:hypothetical protein
MHRFSPVSFEGIRLSASQPAEHKSHCLVASTGPRAADSVSVVSFRGYLVDVAPEIFRARERFRSTWRHRRTPLAIVGELWPTGRIGRPADRVHRRARRWPFDCTLELQGLHQGGRDGKYFRNPSTCRLCTQAPISCAPATLGLPGADVDGRPCHQSDRCYQL